MPSAAWKSTGETGNCRAGRIWAIVLAFAFLELAGISADFSTGGIASAAEPAKKGEDPAALWEGNESELAEPFTGVIGDMKEWTELWEKAFGKIPPSVDFERYAVACVFLGHYPGWWYYIALSEPRVSGSTIFIPYQLVDSIVELSRGDGSGITRKYGSRGQYRMKAVEKKPGFSLRMEMVGKPQVQLKDDFEAILKKDSFGEPDKK
jgi:hypothetical protein